MSERAATRSTESIFGVQDPHDGSWHFVASFGPAAIWTDCGRLITIRRAVVTARKPDTLTYHTGTIDSGPIPTDMACRTCQHAFDAQKAQAERQRRPGWWRAWS